MRDLVERQAVMDAIEAEKLKRGDYLASSFVGFETAEDVVRGLPSAQYEIIRCGQCKYAEVADKEDAQDGYTCQFHRGSIWFSGSFCSWAERRTNG